jgi:hypothetical protein
MLLLILAALGQVAGVDAHPRDAALLCGAAVAHSTRPSVRQAAQLTYFVVAAMHADPRPEPFGERLSTMFDALDGRIADFNEGGALAGRAEAVAAECDRHFPLARSNAPARLPAEPVDRDQLCFDMLSFLRPSVRDLEPAGTPSLVALERAQSAYDARIVDHYSRAQNLPPLVTDETVGEQMAATLDYGNAHAIGVACIAQLER